MGLYFKQEVRVMALRLLYKCAKCPTHVILPLRKAVSIVHSFLKIFTWHVSYEFINIQGYRRHKQVSG